MAMNHLRLKYFAPVCILLVTLGAVSTSFAQGLDDLVTVVLEGNSKAESSVEASREIQSKILADAARDQALQIIGEKRYQKNKAAVESRIVRQAVKFIPFVNPGQPEKLPDGNWKMAVELKLSTGSLRKMILEAGLLNDAEGSAMILPMVAFTDQSKGLALRWWMGGEKNEQNKLLEQLSRSFHESLQREFAHQGFHVIRPQESQGSPLPEPYRLERFSNQEMSFISDYFQAPMILRGEMVLRESPQLRGAVACAVKLQVVQVLGQRTVAEVSRFFDTEVGNADAVVRMKMQTELPDIAKDLAVQVFEAWQKGTLNTNILKLTVRGRLSPKQLGEFKAALLKAVPEVKAMKERLFEKDQVQFELDYTGTVVAVADKIKSMSFAGGETRLAESIDKSLVLDIKTR